MGLDMYLYKKTYVKNWDFKEDNPKHFVSVKLDGKMRQDIKPERVTYIEEEVAYWRKFNALHGYIVENHAGGVDECQDIRLELSDLELILETLKEVIKSKPNEDGVVTEGAPNPEDLLPPTEGFFFGSNEVDEYYYEEVESTIEELQKLIDEVSVANEEYGLWGSEFIYRASW